MAATLEDLYNEHAVVVAHRTVSNAAKLLLGEPFGHVVVWPISYITLREWRDGDDAVIEMGDLQDLTANQEEALAFRLKIEYMSTHYRTTYRERYHERGRLVRLTESGRLLIQRGGKS